jgi:26S proteasome regulatory subunit T6
MKIARVGMRADASLGMYALRERRQYVGQEDFEMAVAKVLKKNAEGNTSVNKLFS